MGPLGGFPSAAVSVGTLHNTQPAFLQPLLGSDYAAVPCPPAGAIQAGRGSTARSACVCRDVFTGRATSLGSASVTPAGLASSVTKVSRGLDIPASGAEGRSPAHPHGYVSQHSQHSQKPPG